MFRDFNHWKAFSTSPLFGELAEGYRGKSGGNKVLAITYYGERQVTSNKPINKPDDMKGLKIRVPDAPLYTMFPRAVGANPTPIAFAEVYLALQNGTVDAQENPLPTIDAKKFYEVQKYIVLTGHITDALLTIVGAPTWAKLSDADKKIFEDVLREAAARATAQIIEIEAKLGRRVHEARQGSRQGRPHAVPQRCGEDAQRPGRDLGQGHLRQTAGVEVSRSIPAAGLCNDPPPDASGALYALSETTWRFGASVVGPMTADTGVIVWPGSPISCVIHGRHGTYPPEAPAAAITSPAC